MNSLEMSSYPEHDRLTPQTRAVCLIGGEVQ